jgi:hypothetical protein
MSNPWTLPAHAAKKDAIKLQSHTPYELATFGQPGPLNS